MVIHWQRKAVESYDCICFEEAWHLKKTTKTTLGGCTLSFLMVTFFCYCTDRLWENLNHHDMSVISYLVKISEDERKRAPAWEVSRLLWIKVQIKSLWLFLRTLAESYCQSWQSCLTTAWRRNNSKPMRGVSCMPYLQECRWAFISHHSIASLIFLVICKHFEAVIYKNIVNHLNRNNLGNK